MSANTEDEIFINEETSVFHEMYTGIWGNDIEFFDHAERRVVGWKTPKVKVGEFLKMKQKDGSTFVFKIIEVEYQSNPKDMFWSTVQDVGEVIDE